MTGLRLANACLASLHDAAGPTHAHGCSIQARAMGCSSLPDGRLNTCHVGWCHVTVLARGRPGVCNAVGTLGACNISVQSCPAGCEGGGELVLMLEVVTRRQVLAAAQQCRNAGSELPGLGVHIMAAAVWHCLTTLRSQRAACRHAAHMHVGGAAFWAFLLCRVQQRAAYGQLSCCLIPAHKPIVTRGDSD